MKIKVPYWAIGIEDQGINVFVAFTSRVCQLYGYDNQYYISRDDVSRMCNKTSQGIIEWLRSYPQIEDNMIIGDLLDTTMVFQISRPAGYRKKQNYKEGNNGIEVELTDVRYMIAWSYLLGCLNHNIISENTSKSNANNNTFGMHAFQITREAAEYIKVSERKAMREKYDDLK
jgi:hypothetical protein